MLQKWDRSAGGARCHVGGWRLAGSVPCRRDISTGVRGFQGAHDFKIMVTEDLEVTVNRQSVREYVERQRKRCQKANTTEKGMILDENIEIHYNFGVMPDSSLRVLGLECTRLWGTAGRTSRWHVIHFRRK